MAVAATFDISFVVLCLYPLSPLSHPRMHRTATSVIRHIARLATSCPRPLSSSSSSSSYHTHHPLHKPRPVRPKRQTHQPPDVSLPLKDVQSGITVQEGGGYVSTAADSLMSPAYKTSRKLRYERRFAEARAVLDLARAHSSPHEYDLVELVHVMYETAKNDGVNRNLTREILTTIDNSPAVRSPVVYNILLSAAAWEVTRLGGNGSAVQLDFFLHAARRAWAGLVASSRHPIHATGYDLRRLGAVWMYRVVGECRSLRDTRDVKVGADRMGISNHSDTAAAYLLCLGKCGRSGEADAVFHSHLFAHLIGDRRVVSALFQSHVASGAMNKAEAIIIQRGANFLDVKTCHAFLHKCALLGLRDKAYDFVARMKSSPSFPNPTDHTYNLLIKALCCYLSAERVGLHVAIDRAKDVVSEMAKSGIAPTTVTFNALIILLADQRRMDEAIEIYSTMRHPNHITFAQMMMGAEKVGDVQLAFRLKRDMDAMPHIYPNFTFCKRFLALLAAEKGVPTAFSEAKLMAHDYGDALKKFEHVGGTAALRMALIRACGQVGDLHSAFDVLNLELFGEDNSSTGALAPLYIATELMGVCLMCRAQGQALEVFYSMKRAGLAPNFEVYEKLIHGLVSKQNGGGLNDIALGPSSGVCADDMATGGDVMSALDSDGSTMSHSSIQGEALDDFDDFGEDDLGGPDGLDADRRPARPESAPNAFDMALALVSEMHATGMARSTRPACYVYNTLIAACGRLGDLDLAYQIFLKMTRHNNPGVIHVVAPSAEDDGKEWGNCVEGSSRTRVRSMAALDIFDSGFVYPTAVNGTYSSIIDIVRLAARPDLAFELFDVMEADRMNEPSQATVMMMALVAVEFADVVSVENMQRVLKRMDDFAFASPEVRSQRHNLRKAILTRHWHNRGMRLG